MEMGESMKLFIIVLLLVSAGFLLFLYDDLLKIMLAFLLICGAAYFNYRFY